MESSRMKIERNYIMREQILSIIEKNSRIDLKELAVITGMEEVDIANEMAKMEEIGRAHV